MTAVVDGDPRAVQNINVTVTPGPPADLTLDPPSATNVAGDEHCVVATVTDEFGNPVPGVPVAFSVTGANPGGGAVATNAAVEATFGYTGTTAGDDTIIATTQDGRTSRRPPRRGTSPGRRRT